MDISQFAVIFSMMSDLRTTLKAGPPESHEIAIDKFSRDAWGEVRKMGDRGLGDCLEFIGHAMDEQDNDKFSEGIGRLLNLLCSTPIPRRFHRWIVFLGKHKIVQGEREPEVAP